jgi:predicted kinase
MRDGSSRRTVPPRLIVLAGLPGVGKSTLAREVAGRLDAAWLRVDRIEAALLRAGIPRSFETGLAAYLAVRDLAADQLRLGRDVVVDAVNGVEPARRMWRELSEECHAPRFIVEVSCSDPREHQRRVESRAPPTPPLPKPTWEEVVRCEYEPWEEPRLSLEGADPLAENLQRIVGYCSLHRIPRAGGRARAPKGKRAYPRTGLPARPREGPERLGRAGGSGRPRVRSRMI